MTIVINGTTGVSGVDGSASTPSYQGTDSNTGIVFPAADTVGVATGGSERMRVDSSGNVLIGATSYAGGGSSPKLYVSSTSDRTVKIHNTNAATVGLHLTNSTTGQGDDNGLFIYANSAGDAAIYNQENNALIFGSNNAERMRIDSSGNVGIGTTSPVANNKLTIDNGANAYGLVIQNTGGNDAGFKLAPNGTTQFYFTSNTDGNAAMESNGATIFRTNSAERARITSGGYFKASNDGTYVSSTGSYHEFRNTTNNATLQITGTDASYTGNNLIIDATRSASNLYNFVLIRSAVNADNEFILTGDGNGKADGTWQNNGADYAEFFESANGQALTLGATVVLDGNKVREATDQDPASAIIGVVRPKEPSKASMVVGNTAWNKWANKYLTDDFDRYIMEDHDVVEWEEQVLEREAVAAVEAVVDEEGNEVSPAVPAQEAVYKTKQHSYESHNIPAGITVPADATIKTHDDKGNKFQHYKLNPAWDKDAEYVNRENRPEWNIIGLLGQVKILKGQPVGDRWTKMRDVSATVEEWMIR